MSDAQEVELERERQWRSERAIDANVDEYLTRGEFGDFLRLSGKQVDRLGFTSHLVDGMACFKVDDVWSKFPMVAPEQMKLAA